MSRFYDDLAPARHRISRINHQIHQNLLNLAWIGRYGPNRDCWSERNNNILANHSLQHRGNVSHYFVQVESPGKYNLLATEREQLASELGRPVRGFPHLFQVTIHRTLRSNQSERKIAVA